jgi:hypothetical protein
MASCPAHCERAWSERPTPAGATPQDAAALFEDACFRACITEMIERSGRQCYGLFGPPFGEAQALYLERSIVESVVPCIRSAGDKGAANGERHLRVASGAQDLRRVEGTQRPGDSTCKCPHFLGLRTRKSEPSRSRIRRSHCSTGC